MPGQRREDQERDYLENYHPTDERVPRFRQLPDSRLVHVKDLFTAEELKTSPTYNEMLLRDGRQDSLSVRLDGPDGTSIAWGLRDPVDSDGWATSRIVMVTALLPHIRQFVRVRQALVRAAAQTSLVTGLLDNRRIGVVHLDRRGRIVAVNDRARRSCGAATGCRTGMEGCAPGRPTTSSVSNGCWPPRCPPPARSRSADRCWSAVGPSCRGSWCTSNPSVPRNRTTARGTSPRWS